MDKSKNIILVMVGLPASGKTTLANYIKDNIDNVKIFSSDKIREELYGDESIQGNSKEVFDILYDRVYKEIFKNPNKKIIIIDACSISSKSRKNIFINFEQYASIYAVEMQTTFVNCIKQNHNRERVVPYYVLSRMLDNYKAPILKEGFKDIIKHNNNEETLKKIKNL